ncbi:MULTISPECIES: hypothetical protein [Mycobacteriaceae]|jgi:glycosyltransferase A (GT-A) superfamily protein (DUF2064 family)|uniref:hypothetical protein n=1 Tax=Mycobacteriaceae TaxID=1762 RepID=UPI0009265BD9|nr:hypothetical protein [Mycolicibacterium austroafricanum]SHW62977.1 Uncharacterised protein [Mycobacteroides abscessus subsp. abscessus]
MDRRAADCSTRPYRQLQIVQRSGAPDSGATRTRVAVALGSGGAREYAHTDADRRRVWVSLTARGRAVAEDLRCGLADKISSVLGSMEAAAQDALVDALRRVAASARETSSDHGLAGCGLTRPVAP